MVRHLSRALREKRSTFKASRTPAPGTPPDAGASMVEYMLLCFVAVIVLYVSFSYIMHPSKPNSDTQAQTNVQTHSDTSKTQATQDTHQTQAQESHSTQTQTATPVNFSWVTPTLELGGLTTVLLFVGVFIHKYSAKHRAKRHAAKAEAAALTQRWSQARALHEEVASQYSSYLLDLSEVLRRPSLSDSSIPKTFAFLEAFHALGSLDAEKITDPAQLLMYEERVAKAATAWQAASEYALKAGLGIFKSEDRRKVERARDLLSFALDPAASEFERGSAFQQAQKLLDGLILVPKQALLAIESNMRLLIEAPKGDAVINPLSLTEKLADEVTA